MLGREKNPGKNSADSSATPLRTGMFQSRPFSDPTVSDEVSPHKQELPDLQTQLERGARFNQSLSRMKVYGNRPAIQPKISVGAPGDKYEQEADRMAQQVMSMPAAVSHPPIQRLEQQEQEEKEPVQTKPLAASITPLVQRETAPAELEEDKQPVQMKRSLQRAAEGGSHDASSNLESQLSSSKGGGSPLPDEVRSFMEPRIGADFGSVRVHTDGEAVQMNQELSAHAFTHGSDIYFGAGKYNPSSSDGKRLLAHELTHVVQQTGGQLQRQAGDDKAKPTKEEEDKKRFEEIKKILDTIPTGKEALKLMEDYKVAVNFKAGGGSYYNSSSNSMVIDSNEAAIDSALTFVHEMNHAKYDHQKISADVKSLSRNEYVKKMVEEEAEGTVKSIEAKIELEGTKIDVSKASFPLEQKYREVYKAAADAARAKLPKHRGLIGTMIDEERLKEVGRKAGNERVIKGFMDEEVVTSNTKESYPNYYGKFWDKVNKKSKK